LKEKKILEFTIMTIILAKGLFTQLYNFSEQGGRFVKSKCLESNIKSKINKSRRETIENTTPSPKFSK
jgi:hypothetical protein